MASTNPALNDEVFRREAQANGQGGFAPSWGSPADELPPNVFAPGGSAPGAGSQPAPPSAPTDTMRLSGTLTATSVLLGILLVAAFFGWQSVTVTEVSSELGRQGRTAAVDPPAWLFVALIAAFGLGLLTMFRPKLARVTGPLYAAAEGLFVGAISHLYDARFDGIVFQAVALTIGVFIVMLVLFATGTVKVTDRLRTMIVSASIAIGLVYLVSIVLRFFGGDVPLIHQSGPVGILFSLVVVGVASLRLLIDFDFIEHGVRLRAPRHMEWFAAFGLMLSLVWLYLEILRLLSKLRSR